MIDLGRFTARRYRLHTRERGSVTVWGDATAHITKDPNRDTLLLTLEYSRSSTLDRWAARHPMGALMQLTCWSQMKTQPGDPPQWAVLGMLVRTTHVSTGLIRGRADTSPHLPHPLRLAWHTSPSPTVAVTDNARSPSPRPDRSRTKRSNRVGQAQEQQQEEEPDEQHAEAQAQQQQEEAVDPDGLWLWRQALPPQETSQEVT